jgi:hypothetical protein
MKKNAKKLAVVDQPIKLDIGCGKNKKEGFIGVDQSKMDGVDLVHDVRQPWPWKDDSVEEVHCSHFLEHLNAQERIHFFNELYRVLKVDSKAQIITPHWCSHRAYGDPTHQWPPVSEMMYSYLDKNWRADQAPHTDIKFNPAGYKCDFEYTCGYSFNPTLYPKNDDYKMFAVQNYKEAAQDIIASVKKRA